MTFTEFGLNESIVKAVESMGFVEPTPIQGKTIPYILNNDSDLIALAQTGTGKTAAFGLPVLSRIDVSKKDVQLMVLCPTRELCLQITGDLQNFARFMKDLEIVPVYGGASIETQIKQLKRKCQIVVATPGRAIDLMERKALKINSLDYLVLDEADEMLSMGFKDDLDTILAETPSTKRTYLFSATMPGDIERMAQNYMNNPEEISVAQKNIAAENVEHQYFLVRSKDRYEALKRIADVNPDVYAIVFCRTRQETKEVADKLIEDHYNADALHGDLSQAQRDNVMQRFRSKHLQILVATDVAARGLDVNDLTHVINYNLPDDPEVYIHRSGRTGRAGKSGISISLIHLREKGRLKDIERICKKKFVIKNVPGGREICEIQLLNLIDKVQNVEIDEKRIESFMDAINEKIGEMTREEIIKKFLSMEFNRFLDYYKNAPDINVEDEKRGDRDSSRSDRGGDRGEKTRRGSRRDTKYSRLFISLGSKDNVQPAKMIGFINRVVNDRDVVIGKIDIMRNFSFFEVDSDHEQQVINSMKGAEFDDIPVNVELSQNRSEEGGEERRSSYRRDRGGERSERRDRGGFSNSSSHRGSFGDRFSRDRGGDRSSRRGESRSSRKR